jgi:hypothetical protein
MSDSFLIIKTVVGSISNWTSFLRTRNLYPLKRIEFEIFRRSTLKEQIRKDLVQTHGDTLLTEKQ